MHRILCFGDSNTYGMPPMTSLDSNERLGPDQRWTGVMAATLGPEWTLIEEGLPGRTTSHDDPVMGAHMNGQTGLRIALASHAPIDVLVLMLGTNDLKTRFAPTPHTVTAGMAGLLDIALHRDVLDRFGAFKILVIAPPPVIETGCLAGEFYQAEDIRLAPTYADLSKARGCGFLDAGRHITSDPDEGVHFGAAAHGILGRAVAEAVQAI